MPAAAIPVIDLFAGPGGLGECFAAAGFDIRLSIEKDEVAHRTLELRAFFRQFDEAPDDYYEHLRQRLTREELFARHPFQTLPAMEETMRTELDALPAFAADLNGCLQLIVLTCLSDKQRWSELAVPGPGDG